jgi:hypothetical protein
MPLTGLHDLAIGLVQEIVAESERIVLCTRLGVDTSVSGDPDDCAKY